MNMNELVMLENWPDGQTMNAHFTTVDEPVVSIVGEMHSPDPKHEVSIVQLSLVQVVKACRQLGVDTDTLQLEEDSWFAMSSERALL